jgi:hypothetical protein
MAKKLYKRSGLNRERNLSDISNPTSALNNIIGPLADIADSTFISEDLDCIRGLSSSGISETDYKVLSGLTVKQTDSFGIDQAVKPLITIKNRIDILEITTGNPRLNGGPGINPKYYNTVSGDGFADLIISEFSEVLDLEWGDGEFEFESTLSQNSGTSKGALVWEGYFIPSFSGTHQFVVTTNGYFKLEFEDDNYVGVGINTYKTVLNTGISTTIDVGTISSSDEINIQTQDASVLGVGLSITGSNISQGSSIESRRNETTYILTNGGVTSDVPDFNQSVNLIKQNLGELETIHTHITRPLIEYRKYFFKLTYFIPDSISKSDAQVPHKLKLELNSPNTGIPPDFKRDVFPYQFLYPLDYDFGDAAAGSFDAFYQTKLPKSGGEIGGTSNSSEYVSLETSSKIKINYVPPANKSSILKKTITTGIDTTSFISVSDVSNIESGNYVLDISGGSLGISTGTRVIDVSVNEIILNQGGLVEKTATLEFLDHRGFVKSVEGSISGTTLTISNGNTNNLKSGMLVVGDGVTDYTGITTTGLSIQVTVSPSQNVGTGTTLYFYESKGLINDSLISFCPTTENVCIISSGVQPAGSTTLNVTDTTGLSENMFVYAEQFPSGTVINSFTPNTITISNPTTVALADGANFTASTSSEEQKALCCPPTDTSPPFDATEEGIDTVGGATTLSVPGTLTFESISIGSSSGISNYSSENSTQVLTIETGGGNYNILCL